MVDANGGPILNATLCKLANQLHRPARGNAWQQLDCSNVSCWPSASRTFCSNRTKPMRSNLPRWTTSQVTTSDEDVTSFSQMGRVTAFQCRATWDAFATSKRQYSVQTRVDYVLLSGKSTVLQQLYSLPANHDLNYATCTGGRF